MLAVIVAFPTPVPVTSPLLFTTATFSSLLVHVIVLSVASLGSTVAVNVKVSPTYVLFDVLLSETDVGCIADLTATVQVAVFPLTVVAVIVAVPCFFPLTLPKLTVATSSLLLVHVIVLSVASLGNTSAVKDKVSPNPTITFVIFSESNVGSTVESLSSLVRSGIP